MGAHRHIHGTSPRPVQCKGIPEQSSLSKLCVRRQRCSSCPLCYRGVSQRRPTAQRHPQQLSSVPHSSPIQSWHASYDSTLHQHRRKADEDASSVTTTGGQGPVSTSPCPNPQSREGGRSAGGVT